MTTRWMIGLAPCLGSTRAGAALVEISGIGLDLQARLVHASHQPYPRDIHDWLLRLRGSRSCEARELSVLHRLLGETFASAARQVADQASFSLQKALCVGCPGQTIWHEAEGRFPSSLSLGMPAVVAERTGITTIGDFCASDLAAGGQGAPLSALTDYLLFRHPQENRLLVHLGGMSQIVYLPKAARVQDVVAIEAGPCNLLLDGLMGQLTSNRERFDSGGKHAVQGRCKDQLLERWLSHPYFQRQRPKCVPRHGFVEEWVLQAVHLASQMQWSLHDLLCTATHVVARVTCEAVRGLVATDSTPTRIFLSGGGVRNGLLWHLLGQQFPDTTLEKTDALGVPTDARKPISFALLAALTVDGVPANLPTATGASGSRLLGKLTPGSAGNWARCLAWMAAQAGPPGTRAA